MQPGRATGRGVVDYIQWSPFFSVSVPELDEDHRELFALVNEFFRSHAAGRGSEQVFHTLNRLVEYAEQHFSREERILEAARYPARLKHRLEHERLVREIFRIHESWEEGEETVDSEVLAFLQNWLQKHILEFDKAYQSHLAEAST